MARAIVLHFKRCDYRRVVRVLRKTRDARTRLWCEIVLLAGRGLPVAEIADQLLCSDDTVMFTRASAPLISPSRPGISTDSDHRSRPLTLIKVAQRPCGPIR